jgi:hypothetical protein
MFFDNINKKEGKMPVQETQTVQKTAPAVTKTGQTQPGLEVPEKKSKLVKWISIVVGIIIILGLVYFLFLR